MNSVFFDHATIDAWIAEDAPLVDLTTHLLAIDGEPARMRLSIRGASVAACTEEAARIVEHCGGKVQALIPSATPLAAGDELLVATGHAAALLRAWKVAQNLLEYACGVAGATAQVVRAVQAAAPGVAVLTTRKHAPGLRRIALKATLCGGAFPHRLGLGETVLVFPQHRALLDGWDDLARRLAAAGADVVQFDKAAPDLLAAWCPLLRARHPGLRLLAAGGIHAGNAAAYAASGVDALVTSSLHHAAPADIGVRLEPVQPGT